MWLLSLLHVSMTCNNIITIIFFKCYFCKLINILEKGLSQGSASLAITRVILTLCPAKWNSLRAANVIWPFKKMTTSNYLETAIYTLFKEPPLCFYFEVLKQRDTYKFWKKGMDTFSSMGCWYWWKIRFKKGT